MPDYNRQHRANPMASDRTRSIPSVTAPQTTRVRPAGTAPSGRRRNQGRQNPNRRTRPQPVRNKRRGHGKLIAGVIAGVLAVGYVAGIIAFSNMTYPHTDIAGVDVSLKTAQSAADRVDSAWKNYRLTVTGDSFSWSYTPKTKTSIVNSEAAVKKAIAAHNALAWPFELVKSLGSSAQHTSAEQTVDLNGTVDLSLLSKSFDKTAFENELGEAVDKFNQGRTGSFDTNGAYDADLGKFTVEKARSNEKLNKENVVKLAEIQLSRLSKTADLSSIGDDAYVELSGGVDDSKLKQACDAANALLGVNVTLKLNGNEAGKIDGSTVINWISFDDALNPTLDTSAVTSWATDVANSFNTVGTTRWYTRPDGKACVAEGGSYGWSVDINSTVKSIEEAVKNKQTGDIDLSYKTKGDTFTKKGEPDWKAYIDVDLTEQHARYYDENGNLLWESGIISGNSTKGNGTPTGIYCINSNSGASTLIGQKDPTTGEPSYKTHVDYWMPFIGNSIGFHDASWQADASFSNNQAYLTVGSHGCINLPPAKAKELSSMIKTGLCVVVHSDN